MDQLDAIDNALNVQNGVLDLAAQTFVAHSPVFRLTKLARACYDPDAKCPKWDATVELFLPDEELREWVQMALGYSMLGRHSEWLFIPYGSGANGKSTILGAVRHALGEYACEAAPELLTERREQSPSSDSARAGLRGRRFVTTVETGRSKRLAEVLMKVLTGEPVITGKYMGKDYFEFQNQTAVWLATNHKPVVQASDLGVWRRIRLIPFTTTLGEDEREDQVKVGDELKAEADGILLWLMEGLRKYQERGSLDPVPKAVAEANAEFKDEMSSLGEWLDECCTLGREEWAPRNKLRESYVEHCKQSGRYELNPANFNSELRALGIEKADRRVNGTQTRGWKGIGLNTEAFLKQVETT